MSTTKQDEEKQELKGEWVKLNLDKMLKKDTLIRLKDLMEQATDALKTCQSQLKKAQK